VAELRIRARPAPRVRARECTGIAAARG